MKFKDDDDRLEDFDDQEKERQRLRLCVKKIKNNIPISEQYLIIWSSGSNIPFTFLGKVEQNIIQTAKNLDRILEILGGKALFVNSWYRPSHVNARVGGSKWSRHMYGDAVDIRSGHLTPYTVYDLLNREHLQGGLGRYSNFVHIDLRGSKARW